VRTQVTSLTLSAPVKLPNTSDASFKDYGSWQDDGASFWSPPGAVSGCEILYR